MAKQTYQDGSTGDVVIRPGPPPASSGGGAGFFGIGGGGGFSGGFGGSSNKRRKARARAKHAYLLAQEQARAQAAAQEQAAAQAQAAAVQAQEHARAQAALHQYLAALTQRHDAIRAEVDRTFAARSEKLAESIQSEISAATKPPDNTSTERWQLYQISKEKNEIDGLIARKNAELNTRNALARSFDGHDPLTRSANDYLTRLAEFGPALNDGHQLWENAYNAAHEARLLSTQIHALTDKSNTLARHHSEQTVIWRDREQVWERHRQNAEQRDARIRFKQQADEDVRHERVRTANTLTVPATSVAGGMVLTRGGAFVIEGAAVALEAAITRATTEILRIAAIPAGQLAGGFVTSMFYSPVLGDGELTAEQRSRLFQGIGVRADLMGLPEGRDLQAIADAGGSVKVTYRIKPEAVQGGTALIVASTGGQLSASVPVVNAVLDPLTGTYHAEIPGSPARQLQFTPDATVSPSTREPEASYPGLSFSASQAQDIPAGVDTRINDCIVCIPGLPPTYLSFGLPPMGSGIVTGNGQPATREWWKAASQEKGAPIPALIGDQFRGREIKSFGAFDAALWRIVAEDSTLASLDEVNRKRIAQGFAPFAPKNTWVADRREYEIRYQENAALGANPYNLDKISITTPRSAQGTRGVVPVFTPWSVEFANPEAQRPTGTRTWTPLVPPGIESLSSTTLPITPPLTGVFPGGTTSPVSPENETYPAVDGGDIGGSIPGYPADLDLPSPDVLFLDRRDDPGVATGFGQPVSGVWLGEAARGAGAPIPSQIADQLRGREFSNFHRFREEFWRAVAADPDLSIQFNSMNLRLARKGIAPFPPVNDHQGARVKFELHHQLEVAQGGAVYDVDNLVVMTPKRHVSFHSGGKQ
jgi:hypothetical protein